LTLKSKRITRSQAEDQTNCLAFFEFL